LQCHGFFWLGKKTKAKTIRHHQTKKRAGKGEGKTSGERGTLSEERNGDGDSQEGRNNNVFGGCKGVLGLVGPLRRGVPP